MTTAEKLQKIAENEQKVYEAGLNSERDTFWRNFQSTDIAMSYYDTFAYGRFTDENYFPRFPIRCANGASSGARIFYNATNISDTKVPIYARKTLDSAFFNCVILRRIPLLSVEAQTTLVNAFSWCLALEEITVEGTIGQDVSFEHCKKLGHLSIENIIEHLSDTATGKTLTLSYDAVYGWWGDDPVPGMIDTSWYELIATKPNWTINLV